ncbi:cupin domain-containing protein [Paractinoplanes globisporus]|uniref:Cupin domain-containing protein n=1 Tax=Paractinoplanes globisporus TaxID=113565 RepID=A0ABW6WEL2_9ACTN|nr:cupin domain-containing protein [Actinoplanes globisporus]
MLPVDLPVDLARAERVLLGTDEITILATGAQTGGTLFAVHVRMRPGGGPPVMHRHEPGEIYYVRAGEFTFYVGEAGGVRRVVAVAGDVVPLAGGTPHTVRNESTADAVAFVVHAPGAPMEGFSRAAAAAAANGDLTMETALSLAAQHGIEMLGPVPDVVERH